MVNVCHSWAGLIVLLFQIWVARADYQCLCSYSVETPVQPSPSESGPPLGYMYEFDCKPVYGDNHSSTTGYQAVQMEHKVGYVKMGDDSLHMIQLCQGSVPDEDKVTVPSSSPPSITTKQILSSPTSQSSTVPPTSTISSAINGNHSASTASTSGTQPHASTSGSTYSSTYSPSVSPLTTISSSVQTNSGSTASPNISTTSDASTTRTTQASFTNVSTQSFAATTVSSRPSMSNTTSSMSSSTVGNTSTSTTTGTTYTTKAYTTTTLVSSPSPSNTTVKTITTSTSAHATPTTSTPSVPTTTRLTTYTITSTTTKPTTTTTKPTTTRPTTTGPTTTRPTTTPTKPKPLTTTRPTTTTAKITTTTTRPATTTTHHLVQKCKVGWTLHQGSCYLFHTSSRANWHTANSICARYRSHLVFIETQDEDVFLMNELRQHIDSHIDDDSDGGVWTGATDDDSEGKWVWHDGNTGRDTHMGHYKHWKSGEPDSGDGDHDEDCMCMIRDDGLKWNDYRCSEHMFYVCEMAPVMTPHAVASSSCEDGWAAYQTSCYYVHSNHRAHWSTAAATCLAEGAHLAIIETQNENTFLKTLLGHLAGSDGHDDDAGVWVGGTDHDKEGQWVWHNDVTGVNTKIGSFTNWHPGEPDSGDHDHDEDCMCMIGDKSFDWQDYKCSESMFYVCEKPMPQSIQPGANKYQLSCPGGWTLHNESCYLFSHSDHLEWDDAGDKCRDSNSHLVIIETKEEQSFLYSQLKHRMGSGSDEGFWTGGSDAHHEGAWVWRNTLTRHETALGGFTNWRSGFPKTGEDCLAMFGNHGYQWEDHRCRNNLYHICEKSA